MLLGMNEYEVRLGDLERSPELLIFALRSEFHGKDFEIKLYLVIRHVKKEELINHRVNSQDTT